MIHGTLKFLAWHARFFAGDDDLTEFCLEKGREEKKEVDNLFHVQVGVASYLFRAM